MDSARRQVLFSGSSMKTGLVAVLILLAAEPAHAETDQAEAKLAAELQEILKSRGLASSGKKADLIARLTESDQAAEVEGKP